MPTFSLFLKYPFSVSKPYNRDKKDFGYSFPCDGPGRGGTCQSSSWDHVFLGLFWMYNSISVVIFHFSWKMQSDVWGTITPDGAISHITGGNFAQSSITINGWLRDFLWSQASQVIQSYGSASSAYGLIFLGAHFIWAFSLMFLFSGRIAAFIDKHPTLKMLALSFLVLVGFVLLVEGWDSATAESMHLKNYVYFSMAFSFSVELLNMRLRKKSHPVELNEPDMDASMKNDTNA